MSSTLTRLTVVALGAWLAAACSGQTPVGPSLQVEALRTADGTAAAATSAAAAAPLSARGSWNGWHVHDLAYGSVSFTDANGLMHEDYNIWPVIWPDYPSDESPVVYCTDGAEKALVGGDGGSKLAAGTCRNELYIIQIQLNASDAPAPAESSGWTALPLGNGFTLYYRLTPR
jgi:hypothetical protein